MYSEITGEAQWSSAGAGFMNRRRLCQLTAKTSD